MSTISTTTTLGRYTVTLRANGPVVLAEVAHDGECIGVAARDTRDEAAIEGGFIISQHVARTAAAAPAPVSTTIEVLDDEPAPKMTDDEVLAKLAEFSELKRQRPGYVHAELMVTALDMEARLRGLRVGA